MPNVVQSKQQPLINWKPLFTLGTESQLQSAKTHFAEFVGYRGVKDKNGEIILDPKGTIHRGEAFPPPINKEGHYLGVLDYELDTFELLFMHMEVMLKWAREHGKTFMATWFIEWSMIYCGKVGLDENGDVILDDQGKEIIVPESWLYFSVTKIKGKVGFWVYRWAKKKNYIIKASKGAKQNTYTNFELNNGAMMQIHDFMSEDPIGEHNWNFALDDIVKKKWQDRPTDTQKAKDQWDILNYIGHMRVFVFGTRKYLGDPLEYLEEVLSDLVMDIKTPFVMEGDFPHWRPKLDANDKEILIAPELHTHEELYKKRDASRRAWMAEEMQDPMALGNIVWDHVNFINTLDIPFVSFYDLFWIYIDRATTQNKASDLTGCPIGLREKKSGRRVVIDDLSDKISMEHLLFKINELVKEYKTKYPHMSILIVIEKQGGGDDFESAISSRTEFELVVQDDRGKVISVRKSVNVLRECRIVMVHSVGNKNSRIEDRLDFALKNEETGIVFLNSLRNSPVVKAILDYPNCEKIDPLDALAIGDFELLNLYRYSENVYEGVIEAFREYDKKQGKDTGLKEGIFEPKGDSELDRIKEQQRKRQRGIFG